MPSFDVMVRFDGCKTKKQHKRDAYAVFGILNVFHKRKHLKQTGGVRGIRTLDPGFSPDAPLAGVCLQPLSHYSVLYEGRIIFFQVYRVNVLKNVQAA